VLNELEKEGVFSRYAIGGAMGATFYTEPVLTFDLDVFVANYADPDSELEDEHDVRGRRRVDCMGRVVTRPSVREIASQCVLIEGAPVQFLPAYNALVEEALNDAQEIMYEDGAGSRAAKRTSGRHRSANRTQQGSGAGSNFARTGEARSELSC